MQSKTELVLKSVVENNLGMRLSHPKDTRCLGTVASSGTFPMCCKIETAGASQALRGRKIDVLNRVWLAWVCQCKLENVSSLENAESWEKFHKIKTDSKINTLSITKLTRKICNYRNHNPQNYRGYKRCFEQTPFRSLFI